MSTAVVVIASADRSAHLGRTLTSLERQERRPDEVVVVRLGAQPLALKRSRLNLDVVSSVATEQGLALGAARNLGAASTSVSRLVFLDVDCIASGDLVSRYHDVLRAHPQSIACGPVRYLREGWQSATEELDGGRAALLQVSEAHPARPALDEDVVDVNDRHELFWSLSFGVTRDTWAALGGFDELFVGYGAEDTDFGLRARALGVDLAWFGGGTAFHQWHEPTRLDPARTGEIVANAQRFRERWGFWPMTGWLHELHALGRIEFDERNEHLLVVQS